jgi:hypothetical protein
MCHRRAEPYLRSILQVASGARAGGCNCFRANLSDKLIGALAITAGFRSHIAATVLLVVGGVCVTGLSRAESYSAEAIGLQGTFVYGINNHGDVVGSGAVPTPVILGRSIMAAFIHWHSDAPLSAQRIGPGPVSPLDYSSAYAINDSGDIVGSIGTIASNEVGHMRPQVCHPFRLPNGGTFTKIPVPIDLCGAQPNQINAEGDILVGGAVSGTAYLFHDDKLLIKYGATKGVGVLIGGINDLGDAVGAVGTLLGQYSPAVFKKDGSIAYLSNLTDAEARWFRPLLINDEGVIVGIYQGYQPAILSPGKSHLNLLTGFSGAHGSVIGINKSGAIVGTLQPSVGEPIAFLYVNGQLHFLKDIVSTSPEYKFWFTYPKGINDAGQIVTWGFEYQGDSPTPGHETRIPNSPTSFLLTPDGVH